MSTMPATSVEAKSTGHIVAPLAVYGILIANPMVRQTIRLSVEPEMMMRGEHMFVDKSASLWTRYY